MSIPPRRWRSSFLAVLVGGALFGAAIGPTSAADAAGAPSVRLIAASSAVTAYRYGAGPAYIDSGVLVAAVRGAFDIRARRAAYDQPITATQYIHASDGLRQRALPSWVVAKGFRGMAGFLRARLTDEHGNTVMSRSRSFCPAGGDMRVNPNGPSEAKYPRYCDQNPFALGRVWGIDRGWATPAFGWEGLTADVPDGRYTLRVSIAPQYRDLFGIRSEHASVTITVKVEPVDGCYDGCPEDVRSNVLHGRGAAGTPGGPLGQARTLSTPTDDTLPDLVALPAWNIQVTNRNERDYIEFAATVWNAGPAPLLVEGYRRRGTDIMDAYQYFVRGDEILGRDKVGLMEYDRETGHEHWHFKQFARYSLMNASRDRVIVSRKEAFCLAPTDAIDLALPGAEWHPGSNDLGTLCGGQSAIWVRETLQAGWGDTYYQSVPGQSLNITRVPNGTYYMAVEANPTGLLHERTASNNRVLRKVVLGGTRGARTVIVSPWQGLDL